MLFGIGYFGLLPGNERVYWVSLGKGNRRSWRGLFLILGEGVVVCVLVEGKKARKTSPQKVVDNRYQRSFSFSDHRF